MLPREHRPEEDLGRVAVPIQKHEDGRIQKIQQKLKKDRVEMKAGTDCTKALGQECA